MSAAFDGGLISSDGGLVLLREAERSIGLAETPALSGFGFAGHRAPLLTDLLRRGILRADFHSALNNPG